MPTDAKLLLTTVCQPYGVATRDAEAPGMQMELFNNQVTREQGVHSPRANFWTFPLYLLAENIRVPTTVLDFPRWRDFVRELRRGYTHVGLSFIQTNVLKARRMAMYIRRHHPEVKILLGGYGTALPDLSDLVPHDAACVGEGVEWLRKYFAEDVKRPIKHPVLYSVARNHVYGYPCFVEDTAVLMPGLGCRNGCFFCSTSSKFGHRYIPILATGRDVFEACRRAEEKLGVTEFAVIDENFLQEPDRARELLRLMEEQGKPYKFFMFASADHILRLGVDFLVRLGVAMIWVGIESSRRIFSKNDTVDARALIEELQGKGISVISSSILFLEHQDRRLLKEEVAWAVGMGSDLHQFMQLTPLPGTPLFRDFLASGKLTPGFPYARMSGQYALGFHHPHFDAEEAHDLTRNAFRQKYETDGPAPLNMAWTALRGYRRACEALARHTRDQVAWDAETLAYSRSHGARPDAFLGLRVDELRRRAVEKRVALWAARVFAPNRRARLKARRIAGLYGETFGPMSWKMRLESAAGVLFASLESARWRMSRWMGRYEFVRQPPVFRREYPRE
jgi:hypothetical protein